MERTSSKLQPLGGQIAVMKDAHLVSLNEYMGAWAQIAPLENDYDHQLEELRVL